MALPTYRYDVVTCDGHGVHAQNLTMPGAKKVLASVKARFQDAEIQRHFTHPDGSNSYWLRGAGGRWIPWHIEVDRRRAKETKL